MKLWWLTGMLLIVYLSHSSAQNKTEDNIKIEIHGDVQLDARFFTKYTGTNVNQFYIRRLRPIVQGVIYKNFDFRLQPNFAGSKIELQDAYLGINTFSFAKFRFGKFKPPAGLERLQSPTNTAFIEFAFPINLVPNRDVGIQISGNLLYNTINYAAGIFNGTVDGQNEDADNNNAKDFVLRVYLQPFAHSGGFLQNIGFGAAYTTGKQKGTNDLPKVPSYRTTGAQTFFRFLSDAASGKIVIANGIHTRFIPQAYLGLGPIGIMGEYVITAQEVSVGTNSTRLTNSAWQTAASLVLTGEKASYNGVKPVNNFNVDENKFGALEVVLRIHQLKVDKDAFPVYSDPRRSASDASAYGIGINWYINEFVKIAVNYEYSIFKNINGLKPLEDERVILGRFQLAF